ncbi:MAG: RidA family protein [Planctomycetota bacterium]|jgi:2-iminobutanoate/2-iminopropanoate deaminase
MNTHPRRAWLLLAACLAGCDSSGPRTTHLAAADPLGPYSGSVRTAGYCFVSGKIGTRGGSFEQEARTALDAVRRELSRSGLAWPDVVQVTVYLTNLDLYGVFNEIYAARVGEPYPARAVVEVAGLPGAARVEIQVIAVRK